MAATWCARASHWVVLVLVSFPTDVHVCFSAEPEEGFEKASERSAPEEWCNAPANKKAYLGVMKDEGYEDACFMYGKPRAKWDCLPLDLRGPVTTDARDYYAWVYSLDSDWYNAVEDDYERELPARVGQLVPRSTKRGRVV